MKGLAALHALERSIQEMKKSYFMRCALVALLLIGCGEQEPRPKVFSVDGDQAARTAEVTRILEKHCSLPGEIADGHWEEHLYDNSYGLVSGPSDLYTMGTFEIEPADKPLWRALLASGPKENLAIETRPEKVPTWFPSDEELDSCEIFHARPIVGRSVGWAALFPKGGRIAFYAFDP